MKYFLLLAICFSMHSQNIQSTLNSIFKKNEMMGLSVYYFDKKTEGNYSFGYRNFDDKLPVTSTTRYRIASISKAFTALGIMKLVDQKKINLDEDISTYLGYKVFNPSFPSDKITTRMLLTHTSSILDGTGYDNFLSGTYNDATIPNVNSVLLPDGKYFTKDMFSDRQPGTYFTYCNLNYGLLGTLIEKASGIRFDIFMKNEILKPLNIGGSFSIQDIADVENVSALYRNKDGWKAQKDDFKGQKSKPSDLSTYEIGTNGAYFGPQGGLRVTAAELGTFLKYLKSNGKTHPTIMSSKTIKLMKQSQWKFDGNNGDNFEGLFLNWGLGLHIANTDKNDRISPIKGNFIGHAGDAYGLISDAYFSENENFGVVLVCNGILKGYQKGKSTSFYSFEEEIFEVLNLHFAGKNK